MLIIGITGGTGSGKPTKRYADLIVPQGGENHFAINILTQYILRNLSTGN